MGGVYLRQTCAVSGPGSRHGPEPAAGLRHKVQIFQQGASPVLGSAVRRATHDRATPSARYLTPGPERQRSAVQVVQTPKHHDDVLIRSAGRRFDRALLLCKDDSFRGQFSE